MKRILGALLVLIISILVFSSCAEKKALNTETQNEEYTAVGKLACESSSNVEETNLNAVMVKKDVTTYAEILSSNAFLEQVSEDIGGVYPKEELRDMVSFTYEEDEILIVEVTADNSDDALSVCESILSLAPDFISEITHRTAKVIEEPYLAN